MDKTPAILTFAVAPQADPSGTGPMRFRGVAYSGGVIPQYGWYGDACIDLASLSLPNGELFALVDHDPTQRAGKFASRVEANQIVVEGELFSATDAGREVAALMREGAPWQMSVGIQAETEQSDKRRAVTCNGQAMEVNTLFKNAALREVSFVPVGADPNTTVAAFSRNLGGPVSRQTEIPVTPGVNQMDIETLQAQVNDLTAKLEAETAARQSAETALEAVKMAARQDALKALSADIGRELTEAETTAMTGMEETVFATMSAAMKSMKPAKPNLPDHLFSEQAVNGMGESPESAEIIKAQAILRNQVSGKV